MDCWTMRSLRRGLCGLKAARGVVADVGVASRGVMWSAWAAGVSGWEAAIRGVAIIGCGVVIWAMPIIGCGVAMWGMPISGCGCGCIIAAGCRKGIPRP